MLDTRPAVGSESGHVTDHKNEDQVASSGLCMNTHPPHAAHTMVGYEIRWAGFKSRIHALKIYTMTWPETKKPKQDEKSIRKKIRRCSGLKEHKSNLQTKPAFKTIVILGVY